MERLNSRVVKAIEIRQDLSPSLMERSRNASENPYIAFFRIGYEDGTDHIGDVSTIYRLPEVMQYRDAVQRNDREEKSRLEALPAIMSLKRIGILSYMLDQNHEQELEIE